MAQAILLVAFFALWFTTSINATSQLYRSTAIHSWLIGSLVGALQVYDLPDLAFFDRACLVSSLRRQLGERRAAGHEANNIAPLRSGAPKANCSNEHHHQQPPPPNQQREPLALLYSLRITCHLSAAVPHHHHPFPAKLSDRLFPSLLSCCLVGTNSLDVE